MARTSRIKRKKQNIVLTERDYKILYTVGRFGLITTEHLAKLFFADFQNTANKRLRSLYNAGFLNRHVPFGNNHHLIYTLPSKGRKSLMSRFGEVKGLQLAPKTLDVADLEHRLAIIDVRVALILIGRKNSNFKLVRFLAGSEVIREMKTSGLSFIPDALILLDINDNKQVIALEMDLGTEPLSVWRQKADAYNLAFRMKTNLLEYDNWTVLVIALSKARLNSIQSNIHSDRFLFVLKSEVSIESVLSPNNPPFLTGKSYE